MKTKFIFVTGGVVSSLGKGLNASSIGRLLKCRGLKVFMQKFDPYINVDPGNMSPLQHGEVFVTEDGAETDLDLGHYERFIDENLNKYSSVTTGKIYLRVIDKERKGAFDGATVQVIPHITDEIKLALRDVAKYSKADVIICEIGGTVGDIESLPFLEAIRQFRRDIGFKNAMYIHNTLVPYISASQELKTKPTQHSVKELRSLGINPDMIILRTEHPLNKSQRDKIALFCDVPQESVIEAEDCENVYEVPIMLAKQKVDEIVCEHLGLETKALDLSDWTEMAIKIKTLKKQAKIALVGKYVDLKDSYLSVYEALKHGAYANDVDIHTIPINASQINEENAAEILKDYQGIIVPGGFGERNVEGILSAIKYARVNKVPYLGICFGLQLAAIEFSRNVLGATQATSREINEKTQMPIIELRKNKEMRLGRFPVVLKPNSKAHQIYGQEIINERHRHRYEINRDFIHVFENTDFCFSGFSEDEGIVEMIELKNHPFFVACQFHPEFLSRPNREHPLFKEFIKATLQNKKRPH
ncbi:MAG: CTP synthase [Bacilli bacterium]|nr:CTP synthase [Bacilli bacterium]